MKRLRGLTDFKELHGNWALICLHNGVVDTEAVFIVDVVVTL